VIEAVSQVLASLTDAETDQRGYLLSDRQLYLEAYVAAAHDALRQLAKLRLLANDHAEQAPRLDTLTALTRAKFAELDTTVVLERSGDHAAALAVLDSDRGKRIVDARRVAAAMEQVEVDLLATNAAHEARIATLVRWMLVVGALLAVVSALLVNALLVHHAAAQERWGRELRAQNVRLEQQTLELELQNEQLQEQAVEVEAQQQHLQDQAAELEAQTKELAAINAAGERTAEELRFGQERLRLALGAGQLGPWEWDIASGVVTWSPDVEAMHGIPIGSFPGTFDAYQRDTSIPTTANAC
jgi:CHASE3 domain sensor protein